MVHFSKKKRLNVIHQPFFSIYIFPLFDTMWFRALCQRLTDKKSQKHAPIGVVYMGSPLINSLKKACDRSIFWQQRDESIAIYGSKIEGQMWKLWGLKCKMNHDQYRKYHFYIHLGRKEAIKWLQKRFGGHFQVK